MALSKLRKTKIAALLPGVATGSDTSLIEARKKGTYAVAERVRCITRAISHAESVLGQRALRPRPAARLLYLIEARKKGTYAVAERVRCITRAISHAESVLGQRALRLRPAARLLYLIEARKKDDTRWETITRTSNGILQEFTISYQSLLPSTAYSFRVIAYNKFGISNPTYSDKVIVTPSKLYLEYGYLQYRPFYRRTWFMVALAAASIIIIIMVIAILCVKSKSYKYKKEAQKTLEESLAGETDERGSLAMDLYRSRQNSVASVGALGSAGGTLRRGKTAPALGKSPPRPSPANVAYHSDEESLRAYDENPDDSSVTEKPSEMSSTDSQNSESENESIRSEPHSFVNHYANVNDTLRQSWKRQRPARRNYSSYTDSEPEGSAVMSLNGGQIVMNNMARSRAPLPGFSSFV
ncbi:hypothetical protein evm_011911 [Chilo suppressalis]|nr:hypothetical protein evm_011911 [Chilo suppressalis]